MTYGPETQMYKTIGSDRANLRHGANFYRYRLIPFLFAMTYATYLTSLPIDAFLDRVNYILYASSSYLIQAFYLGSYASYLANEPLWLAMNIHLYEFFEVDTIIRIFIFFPAFITAYIVMSKRNFGFLIAFAIMLIPGVAQNYIVHIRQGVAVSIFLIGYFSNKRKIANYIIAISPFIHSAFFLIAGIYFACEVFKRIKFVKPQWRITIMVAAIILATVFMETVMAGAAFRQTNEYRNIATEISGLGFLVWSFILALICSQGVRFVEENLFSVLSLIFYLMIYFFAPFAGRVIECVVIPIFFTGMMMAGWKRWAFAGIMFAQAAAFYVLNSGSYWFGWGV